MNTLFFANLVPIFLLLLAVFTLYQKIFRKKHFFKKPIPSLNCSKVGNLYTFVKCILGSKIFQPESNFIALFQYLNGYCHLFKKEGICEIYVSMKPTVLLYKPETVEVVLKSSVHIDKPMYYDIFNDAFGPGLFTSKGQEWHNRRKLLTPPFKFQKLKQFLPIFNIQSDLILLKLRSQQSTWTDITTFVLPCVLDIIYETTMGHSLNALKGKGENYNKLYEKLKRTFVVRVITHTFHMSDFLFANFTPSGRDLNKLANAVSEMNEKIISGKRVKLLREQSSEMKIYSSVNNRSVRKKHSDYRDLLEYLLKYQMENPSFTNEDLRSEMGFFIAAGHETSASAISFSLFLIGLFENRNIQERIHQELDSIFGYDKEREITVQDLTQMKYLECTLKETMRLYPPVPFFARQINEVLKIGDFEVEKDSIIIFCIPMLHRDPESFPKPEKFDPERFFPENAAKRHAYSYVPFAAGPRSCIGLKMAMLEMKCMMANILRNFILESKDPRDKMNVFFKTTLESSKPILIKFTPRY